MITDTGRRAMEAAGPKPVFLQHAPEWVVREFDRLYGLVESGHITVHKNDGETVKFEERAFRSAKQVKAGQG